MSLPVLDQENYQHVSSDWVKHAGQALKLAGYMQTEPTGVYDEEFAAAVRAFQTDNGISEENQVGPDTWEALGVPDPDLAQSGQGDANPSSEPSNEVGQLSEDGLWRWDGTQWVSAGQGQSGQEYADLAQFSGYTAGRAATELSAASFDGGKVAAVTPSFDLRPGGTYRLGIGLISMYTEGGGIVHEKDEAFATEKVLYYAEVTNRSPVASGPFEVNFLIDGERIGEGGMSHRGLQPNSSEWFQGATRNLSPGEHTLEIKTEPEDEQFEGDHTSKRVQVLKPKSGRAFPEGEEVGKAGWSPRQLYLHIEDFRGELLPHGMAYLTFAGPRGEVSKQGEVVDGRLTLDDVWTPDGGGLLTLVVATKQGSDRRLTGGTKLPKTDPGQAIVLSFTQDKTVRKESATSAKELVKKLGLKLSANVGFAVFSYGVEVNVEEEQRESHSKTIEYEVWTPANALQHSGDDTASARDR